MKKLTALILAVVLSVILAVPAIAQTTSVTVVAGGGNPPIIKVKWETPDDGDPTHVTPGTQVLPSGQFQVSKEVWFWAVVTDPEGVGTIRNVYADVFHPAGPPENGSFKYQLQLNKVDKQTVGIPAFQDAEDQHLTVYNSGFDFAEVSHELEQSLADVYWGVQYLSYHQPAGDYTVKYKAYDTSNNPSAILSNLLTYVATTAMELDFTNVDYGSVMVSTNKWIGGDTTFGTAGFPTVRNVGNTNLQIKVKQNDMGLGTTSGVWNVEFDARLGAAGVASVYNPDEEVTLADVLPLCNTQKLDFSVHVKKADPGSYSGTITLSPIFAPFPG